MGVVYKRRKRRRKKEPEEESIVALLISDKEVFKTKSITRSKECHLIKLKELIHQVDITILNVYFPYNRTSKHKKQ